MDIEYIYEEDRQAAPDRLSQRGITAMLADAPNELLNELGQATLALDREASVEIISRIARKNPELAASLKSLVENYKLAELRDLLEKGSL